MENSSNKRKFSPTVWHPAARWAFVLGLCAVAGVIVSYYWRVFYGLDARGVPPLQITGLCVVLSMAAGADVYDALGVSFAVPWLGMILTGILASRGSNYIADFVKRLQTIATDK